MQNVTRLFDVIYHQKENYPKKDALCTKVNGKWNKLSMKQVVEEVNNVSKGLLAMGIKPGDKIALISSVNRSEWNIMDLGALQIGVIDVPVYPTITEADYQYIFNEAEVQYCFVSDAELAKKIQNIKPNVPSLVELYSFDDVEGVKSWREVQKADGDQAAVDAIKDNIKPEDLATIIYTSGTTGNPKGVMLTHNNLLSNVLACIPRVPVDHNHRALSFLPVCHVYERMIQYLYFYQGVSIYFAESMEMIGDNIREVKPGMFTAVPRLLEKVYDKIIAKGEDLTGLKRKLFFWAVDLGLRYELDGKNGWWYEFQLGIARKLIFSKWQEALGGEVKAVASGSAALQTRLARVFLAAGIPVFEGYGLTETSPTCAVNSFTEGFKFNSVGPALDGVEIKIAEDGEIVIKGPNVMVGYYKQPEKTAEVLTADGWFHTGDIGELDEKGFLRITDRKKEIFKTSGGKYIAPQQMENKLKESVFVEQVMVLGENEKHPAAFIVPSFEVLISWANKNGINCSCNADYVAHDKVKELFHSELSRFNKDFGGWEQIKKFELMDREWTVEDGEITPTLKLKRKAVVANHQAKYDAIYR